jgi:hypothetical protein
MRFHRARIGVAIVAMGVAMTTAMDSGAPASAALRHGGSDPNSAFCKLEKDTLKDENSKIESAATDALIDGKWKTAQKDLIQIDKSTGKLEQSFFAALSSAPDNVKAAADELVKLIPAEEKAVKDSTSVTGFEKAEQAVASGKFTAAAKVLAGYDTSLCGSLTPTT